MSASTVRPALGRVGLTFYNVLYWPYLFGTCMLLFWPALAIWLVTIPFDRRLRLLHAFTCLWGAHYLAWAPFAGVRVVGRERVPDRPVVYVSNHQSMVDTLAVFAIRMPFKWVSKVENFWVPFLGWNMALNRYVALKRGHLPSILRMVRTCLARLREGSSLFIFPEGTRSPDGELLPFFRGAFRIAVRSRVPVVPVLIEGTGVILPKSSFSITPVPVLVEILDPIDPADVGFDHKRLHDVVRARMAEAQDRIRGRRRAA
jgi:1-acyl-sn-glycerol-3-phosphate acyltransferase